MLLIISKNIKKCFKVNSNNNQQKTEYDKTESQLLCSIQNFFSLMLALQMAYLSQISLRLIEIHILTV